MCKKHAKEMMKNEFTKNVTGTSFSKKMAYYILTTF